MLLLLLLLLSLLMMIPPMGALDGVLGILWILRVMLNVERGGRRCEVEKLLRLRCRLEAAS